MKKKIVIIALIIIALVVGIYYSINNFYYFNLEEEIADTSKVIPPSPLMFGIRKHDFLITSHKVESGQNLSTILNLSGLDPQLIEQTIVSTTSVFNLKSIRAGNMYHQFFGLDSAKSLKHLVYEIDKINFIHFDFSDSISVSLKQHEVIKDTVVVSGVIKSSLWNTMKDLNIDPMLTMKMADIYAWSIDFYGLQVNDSFSLVYISNSIDSVEISTDKILSGKFNHDGKNYYAFYFVQDSVGDYFDEKGESLRRAFLKAPLKFSRISSHFTNSRYHPVLKIRRPHHGVDYAAPSGTPVMSIGDGKVISASWDGGYGRRVVIKHNSNYSTGYAHLSGYAKGLNAGDHVRQGEVIGYVGSSGLSTGPHLDFRVYKNSKPIDPLKMESPPSLPVNKNYLNQFNVLKKSWLQVLGN
jgi:murein DD-endopeptidase MepM/ murein hydrolase activator NlpD